MDSVGVEAGVGEEGWRQESRSVLEFKLLIAEVM